MKIRLFVLGTPGGDYERDVDWPAVPRVGDTLHLSPTDDEDCDPDGWVFSVESVQWNPAGDVLVCFSPGHHKLTGALLESYGYTRKSYD